MAKFGSRTSSPSAPVAPPAPPAKVILSLTLPLDLAVRLVDYAAERRTSKSAAIRELLNAGLP
jgi:hypothetical protein